MNSPKSHKVYYKVQTDEKLIHGLPYFTTDRWQKQLSREIHAIYAGWSRTVKNLSLCDHEQFIQNYLSETVKLVNQ